MNARRLLRFGVLGVAVAGLLALLLWLTGYSPFQTVQTIFASTWGSPSGRVQVLNKAALLILTGLAVAVPYRAGLFNIGGEGQMLLGGLAAAFVGWLPLSMFGPLHWTACLVIGAVAGACWGALAGCLRTWRGIHEVISTIMLNFIALQCVNEITFGVFNAGGGASRTPLVLGSAHLPSLAAGASSPLHCGVVIAIVVAVGGSVWLHRIRSGFQLRAVGENPDASRSAGMPVSRIQWSAMAIGGGFAGLAGAIETSGMTHAFYARFSGGMGFDGIAVAFLALCEPWATVPAALALATLRSADRSLQLELGLPKEIVFVVEGVLVIVIALLLRRRSHV
ncbi:MAG: ABC transporter permease [Candidatus Hinthialibacter antarcticus]|nr:ABC transporter permease [Candidatus Hinthialibacter antarcticus]